MNIDDIKNANISIFETNENELFSATNGWKKTFETIKRTLTDVCNEQESERVINKIYKVIEILIREASTYEDLVINIAQIYLFVKETNLDLQMLKKIYGEKFIDAVNVLNNNFDKKAHLKAIFENEEYKFLGKIKLAELIEEMISSKQIEKETLLEIDEIIKLYQNNANQKLIKILKELRLKIK